MKTTVTIVLLLAVLCQAKKSYDGYAVFRITPKIEQGTKFIAELAESKMLGEHLDFWRISHTLSDPTDVMVPPRFIGLVKDFLHRRRMEFSILIENVGDLMEQQAQRPSDFSAANFYEYYHTMEEIEEWMDDLSASNPHVTKVEASRTIEGRTVSGLRISFGSNRPAVIFQGGIHAREWISPATMMNIARKLLENSNTDDDVKSILNYYDIYIIPVLNVDGYLYSWSHDRMWRKNRNLNDNARCMGVDLNRNWDVGFGGDGAYKAKCSLLYHGKNALSEPETSGMNEFAQRLQEEQKVHVFIDFHSYGLYWMWPWGYTTGLPPTPDDTMQKNGSRAAAKALESVHGVEYKTHPSALMYGAGGATEDWAYYTLKAKYSYIVELRPENGDVGFLLPAAEIKPTGEETFAGVKDLLLYTMADPYPVANVTRLPHMN